VCPAAFAAETNANNPDIKRALEYLDDYRERTP